MRGTYLTRSYWKYALFSKRAGTDFLAAVGALNLLFGLLDFFRLVPKETIPKSMFFMLLGISAVYVLVTRRPVTKVTYKVPKKDLCLEVRMGDLLDSKEDIVVSCNSTFDTDISSGLINPKSIQGQVLLRFFDGKTEELDKQIKKSLGDLEYTAAVSPGNKKRYPIGTVAKIVTHGKNFYFLAMAELNEHGTARSNSGMLEQALDGLWAFVAARGEFGSLALPAIGTGRGRVQLPRRRVIEMIAQSFVDASRDKVFVNKLAIVVHPEDARIQEVNLFEIKDYFASSLLV